MMCKANMIRKYLSQCFYFFRAYSPVYDKFLITNLGKIRRYFLH